MTSRLRPRWPGIAAADRTICTSCAIGAVEDGSATGPTTSASLPTAPHPRSCDLGSAAPDVTAGTFTIYYSHKMTGPGLPGNVQTDNYSGRWRLAPGGKIEIRPQQRRRRVLGNNGLHIHGNHQKHGSRNRRDGRAGGVRVR